MKPLKPFRCERCDAILGYVEVTAFGDMERRYLPTFKCDCPGPRCIGCHGRLKDLGDGSGRCTDATFLCYLADLRVPIMLVA